MLKKSYVQQANFSSFSDATNKKCKQVYEIMIGRSIETYDYLVIVLYIILVIFWS